MEHFDRAIRLLGKTNSYIELALNTCRWSAATGAPEALARNGYQATKKKKKKISFVNMIIQEKPS